MLLSEAKIDNDDRPPGYCIVMDGQNVVAAGSAINAKRYRQLVQADSTMTSPPTKCWDDPSLTTVGCGSQEDGTCARSSSITS